MGWRINLGGTVFMTACVWPNCKQKTLDKRKHCTRELFSVVLTEISHKKTLKVSCGQIILLLKKRTCVKRAFKFEPEGFGLGKAKEDCHV